MTNAVKVLLQMTSVSLQPVPSLGTIWWLILQIKMEIGNRHKYSCSYFMEGH
jgi:hypothetical protein